MTPHERNRINITRLFDYLSERGFRLVYAPEHGVGIMTNIQCRLNTAVDEERGFLYSATIGNAAPKLMTTIADVRFADISYYGYSINSELSWTTIDATNDFPPDE